MIVGIIGSGGREHAICKKIKESPKVLKYFVFQVMQEQAVLHKI